MRKTCPLGESEAIRRFLETESVARPFRSVAEGTFAMFLKPPVARSMLKTPKVPIPAVMLDVFGLPAMT